MRPHNNWMFVCLCVCVCACVCVCVSQLIAAAVRVIVSSCHDCVLNLATPRPPLLIGDCRFVRLAPYNTRYERQVRGMYTHTYTHVRKPCACT